MQHRPLTPLALIPGLLLSLPLGSFLPGQSSFVSPKIAAQEEGSSAVSILGGYADMRYQIVEGDFLQQPAAITRISYRLDTRNHVTLGRSWSSVRLSMASCSYGSVGATFSQNYLAAPTEVFSSAVVWPAQDGLPLVHRPTAWGGAGNQLTFPCKTPWQHTGQQDFLVDLQFHGGVMLKGEPWGRNIGHDYYLDGDIPFATPIILAPQPRGIPIPYPLKPNGCSDQGQILIPKNGSEMFLESWVFHNAVSLNQLTLTASSSGTARGAPVMHALALTGTPTGLDLGARCNRLHLDPAKPWAFFLTTADSRRGWATSFSQSGTWTQALGQLEIWGQAAWSDSQSGVLSLSRACRLLMPTHLPTVQLRKALYARSSGNATVAISDPLAWPEFLPVTRYEKK